MPLPNIGAPLPESVGFSLDGLGSGKAGVKLARLTVQQQAEREGMLWQSSQLEGRALAYQKDA